jgi:hypothetical protein
VAAVALASSNENIKRIMAVTQLVQQFDAG